VTEPIADVLMIQQRPPRQDSLEDQLRDLHVLAARLGCYDAADWLWRNGLGADDAVWAWRQLVEATPAPSNHCTCSPGTPDDLRHEEGCPCR
jgi:hypothetical protein